MVWGDQLRSEEPNAAAVAYSLALAANPEGVQAHLGLASVAYTQSNFSGCLGHLAAVLKRQPDHAGGTGLKALALGALSRHPEAVAAANRALTLAPQEARLHHYAGVVHYGAGKHPEATRFFEQATQLDASYSEAWYNLAWLYVQEEPGRKNLATAAYEKWKTLGGDPDSLLEAALK